MANDIGGVWRTIGGRRVFIKEGQDLASAMKESGKFKSASKGVKKEDNGEKTKNFDDKFLEKAKALDDRDKGKISEEEYFKRLNDIDGLDNEKEKAKVKENLDRLGVERPDFLKDKDKVLEDFKNSDGSKENFEKALNKISEMEYNNEINPDEYKDYISKIQKEYVEKNRKANSDREALRNTEKEYGELSKKMQADDYYYKPEDDRKLKELRAKADSERARQGIDTQEKYDKLMSEDSKTSNKEVNGVKLLTPRDKEKGTYIEDLINQHNKLVEKGDTNYKTLQSLKKEIAERRKTFSNTDDLMTAEQLKGKDREEQKEINKQYLKEQNKLAKEKTLLAQIQEETDSYAYKELLDEYNAGKVTTADLEDTLKTLKKFNGDNEDKANIDTNFAKEWYEGTKKTENMAKENLERAKRNGASVEELSNRTRQVHELELESQKAQEHSNKMNAKVNTPVTQLSDLRDRFYKAKSDRENNQIREYTKSALEAVKEGTTLGLVVKESTAGWTNMGGWHDENTTVKKYTKIGPNKWDTPYGVKTDEDMVLTALYNNEPLRDLQEANDIAGIKSMSDKSSFRYYGNSGPNRVTYKNQSSDNQFTMYNSQYDKEVTVKKGVDGKWVDSDGNKYMGYLSKQDVKQYFKGNWKESTKKRTASEIISSQMSKTRNAKIEVANALGLKYDNDNEWKSTSQLYKEQKGKDIANIAIDSGKADKYNAFVKKNYNREDKNFSDRTNIDKYAKDNNLDADALYYMTKIASESDRAKLKKKAFELYKKQHPNTKKTIYSFEDDIK